MRRVPRSAVLTGIACGGTAIRSRWTTRCASGFVILVVAPSFRKPATHGCSIQLDYQEAWRLPHLYGRSPRFLTESCSAERRLPCSVSGFLHCNMIRGQVIQLPLPKHGGWASGGQRRARAFVERRLVHLLISLSGRCSPRLAPRGTRCVCEFSIVLAIAWKLPLVVGSL